MASHRYIEYALGGPDSRNTICAVNELGKFVLQAQQNNLPLYRSYYLFDEGIVDYVQKTGSVKGYKGPVYIDRITFDIDRGKDSDENVLLRARAFVLRLLEDHDLHRDHIYPWYSGTGYHIQINDHFGFPLGTDIPSQLKATLTKHFSEADDIYDRTRILRVAHTINAKSGLYKIPLTVSELLNMSHTEIMELAKVPRMTFRWPETEEPITKHLNHLIVIPETRKTRETESVTISSDSTGIVTCMQKMYAAGPSQGTRHQDILRLASAWRRGGVPYQATVAALQDWAPAMPKTEVERTVNNVYVNGYRYGCKDHTFHKWCDPGCIFYKHKDYAVDLADATQMEKNFVKFVNTDFAETSFDLKEFYMMPHHYRVYPGEFVVVYGDTGTGKTAWVQNLCVNLKRMDILYLSLEVHQNLLYRRFIQIEHGMTKEKVVDYYRTHTNHLSNAIRHIQCITMAVDLNTIHRLVAEMRPKIVVVDVLDGINVEGARDEITKGTIISRELKQIAQQQNVIIIGIHHISKSAAENPLGKTKALTVHSGKGASTLEQKADKVIGIEGDRDQAIRVIKGLKSRDEQNFRLSFKVDPSTFRFEQQI